MARRKRTARTVSRSARRFVVAVLAVAVVAAVVVGALRPQTAEADIYTYTDENGVVHFTNIPPRHRRGVRVAIRTREAHDSDDEPCDARQLAPSTRCRRKTAQQ